MIINKLEIKNFGKFHEKQVKFGSGINVVYGENESGKSTLHTFIRSMLFGMEHPYKEGEKADTYERCEPWGNPTYYAGRMEFTCGKKPFLLSRNFYREAESVRLVNQEDGEELSVENGDLQMLLGGINEGIFDHTVSIGQLKCVTGRALAKEVQSYIVNYEGGDDENMNPTRAVAELREKKLQMQSQKEREQELIESKLRELQAKTELLQAQQEGCQNQMEELQKSSAEKVDLAKPIRSAGSIQKHWNKIAIALTLLAFVSLILGFVFSGDIKSVLFFGGAVLAGILVPVSFAIQRRLAENTRKNRADKAKNEQGVSLGGKLQQMQEECQERRVMLENLLQEQEELGHVQYDSGQIDEEIEAVNYAIEMMEKTIRDMQTEIRHHIRLRTGEILGELTDGKYCGIVMEDDMDIQVQTPQGAVELYQLSRGALEQVYFSLRMAVGEVLCEQEEMPVIFDDVFAMYDETRLGKTLDWLAKHKEQVIILTCHKREGEILDRMGVLYKKIVL